MSGLTLKAFSSAESEFFAEETLITISPNFSHDKLLFTSGSFGPFEAGDPCIVPLWLAITLRKRGKCTIVIPDWMSASSLEHNIINEKSQDKFEPLPFHYREISQLLLNYARDDAREPDRTAALLQDIDNVRMDRAKVGMIAMSGLVRQGRIVSSAGLTNIASIEVLTIRRFLVESLATMYRLIKVDESSQEVRGGADFDQPQEGRQQVSIARPLRRFRNNEPT